jgi:hypothetical protein
MSDPSDKSRRNNESGPLPRTNRPRPERGSRRTRTGSIPDAVQTPPPSSVRSSPEGNVLSTPTAAAPQLVPEEALPSAPRTQSEARRIDESEALLAERPTQLAVPGPPALQPASSKATASRVLKQASLEMATPAAGTSRSPATPYLDSVIDGRYRIDGVLGRGGMGVVYRSRHEVLEKPFAIKILLPTEDGDVVERFVNEARAATAIGNAHIVDTIDFGQLPDGSTYFVMEYLEGRTLSQRIKAQKVISVAAALFIARQIAEGMSAAHRAGIVHRDLKPENIFLTRRDDEDDFVKLLDFGIAKMQARENRLTRAGTIFGTPHYMSPEQASASEVDLRADIYSLGVILYEMLAGQVPFDAENPMGLLTQHLYTAPVPLTERKEPLQHISTELDAVVLKCLAKRTSDRYASMDDFVADLDRLEQGAPPVALEELVVRGDRKSNEPIVQQARRRLRARPGALQGFIGAVTIGGALLAGAWFLSRGTAPQERRPAVARAVAVQSAPRVNVALVFSPIDAEVFRDGKSLGGMPVTVSVARGEVVTVEIRRDGFYPEKVRLDGDKKVVTVRLKPVPGVQLRVPVPSSEPLEVLGRAAAARAMLVDAGAYRAGSEHTARPSGASRTEPSAPGPMPPETTHGTAEHPPGPGESAPAPAASTPP